MATNVRALLDRVGFKTEQSPQDRNTRAARLEVFNRFLLDLSTDQPWRFLQTEADFKVWKKRTYDYTGFTATVTAGSTEVVWNGTLGTDFMLNNNGMEFNDGLGDALTSSYTVGRFFLAGGNTHCYLTAPYAGSSATLTTWFIGNDKVLLPVDCAQPLGFIDRVTGRGRLISWDRRREELFLSPMGTGNDGTVWWIVDGDTPYDRPPDPTFRWSLSTVAGTLDASSIYQYAYTFECEGRESPASIVLEATTGPGATNQVVLAGIENTLDGGQSVGRHKRLYRRQISRGNVTTGLINGPWMFIAEIIEANTTYTDDGSVTPTRDTSSSLYYEGPSQFMRPKQSPSGDEVLRVRYLMRARKLVADSDVPDRWPSEYYDLLVLYVAMELVGSNSELSKAREWERQAAAMKKRMMENWVQMQDLPTQRMGWGVGPAPGWTDNCGVVVSNYSGNT